MDQLTKKFEDLTTNESLCDSIEFEKIPPWTDYEASWNEMIHELIDIDLLRYKRSFDCILRLTDKAKYIKCKSITYYNGDIYDHILYKLTKWSTEVGVYTFLHSTITDSYEYGSDTLIAQNGIELYDLFMKNLTIYYDFDFTVIDNEEEQVKLHEIHLMNTQYDLGVFDCEYNYNYKCIDNYHCLMILNNNNKIN